MKQKGPTNIHLFLLIPTPQMSLFLSPSFQNSCCRLRLQGLMCLIKGLKSRVCTFFIGLHISVMDAESNYCDKKLTAKWDKRIILFSLEKMKASGCHLDMSLFILTVSFLALEVWLITFLPFIYFYLFVHQSVY